jgi:hypothetical protein
MWNSTGKVILLLFFPHLSPLKPTPM